MASKIKSNLTAVDPINFEIKKNTRLPYPNYSGTLSTGGGLVFLALFDGTVAAFEETDQRRYFVPCPRCGHMQWLVFERLRWEKGKPETAHYICEACDGRTPRV